MPSSDAAANPPSPATPRDRDAGLSAAQDPGSASTVGMFSPAPSSGADSAGEPGPFTASVDYDAARFPEGTRGSQNRPMQETRSEGRSSSAMLSMRREELIPDSMRKTTLANLETKTLKAYLLTTRMRMRRLRIGCHTSRSICTRRCGREFAVSLIRIPTRSGSRQHKWTSGRTWMC